MTKKPAKTKTTTKSDNASEIPGADHISTKSELKSFLLSVRDKMEDETAAPLFALTALNYVMSRPDIYDLLDNENREIARDIWLRIRKGGIQLKDPPMLF